MLHQEFFDDIKKGDIGYRYLFAGEEKEMMRIAIQVMSTALKARVLKYEIYDVNEILKLLKNRGLFGEKYLIVIDNEKVMQDITSFQGKANNYLVIINNGRTKAPLGFEVVEFNKLTIEELRKFAQKQLKVSTQVANLIVAVSEYNLSTMKNNISKIRNYVEGREVTEEDIEKICYVPDALEVFHIIDSIGRREKEKAIYAFHNLNENNQVILAHLYAQFRKIAMVKYLQESGKNADEISTITGLHRFMVENCLKMAPNFGKKALIQILKKLGDIDVGLKTGKYNDSIVYSFILYII